MRDRKRHHHGDLREALILAGMEILEEGGPDALTLRKCAARAGVSHAAPAHHFKGLLSLKTAIVARGHSLFAEKMRTEARNAAPDPRSQLEAICLGYVAFSRDHKALFKFMFQPHDFVPEDVDATTRDEVMRESAASYQILRDACAPFEHPGGNPIATETMVWSLVHGYAMLFCDGNSYTPAGGQTPEITEILPRLNLTPGT